MAVGQYIRDLLYGGSNSPTPGLTVENRGLLSPQTTQRLASVQTGIENLIGGGRNILQSLRGGQPSAASAAGPVAPPPVATPRSFTSDSGANITVGTVQKSPKTTPTPKVDPRTPQNLRQLIVDNAGKIGPEIFSSLLARESMGFNPNVLNGRINSPAGAQGVAQFMPQTLDELVRLGYNGGKRIDPYDPNQAIPASSYYLNEILGSQFEGNDQSIPLTLGAYNAGPGRITNDVLPYLQEGYTLEDILRLLPNETKQYIPGIINATSSAVPYQ